MKTFERLLPGEDADIKEIVAGILHAQARTAKAQHRPLGRGTHTKGVCVRGSFEVYDLSATIADPYLRARLARGLFARPGVYPATIRFANADVTIAPDSKPDVRGVSFAVTVPPGVLEPDAVRRDFSMNSATTFPINDAHAFAVLTRFLEGGGAWGKLKALATMNPSEMLGLVMVAVRGAPQKIRSAVRPYQRLRYWSNTPFRHGPDEAMKYSVTAKPANSGRDPAKSDNMLRDDLLRHVQRDQHMAEFEFGIQLLEADRMRHRGERHSEIYWVENASVEWPEDQAPFHAVGRLTLERGSQLSDEECQAFYIDVNEHSAADGQPLGSINRARWHAESASRRARLGGTAPVSVPGAPLPPAALTWEAKVGRTTLGALAGAGLLLLILTTVGVMAFSYGMTMKAYSDDGMLPPEHAEVYYPSNGWGAGYNARDRQTFYYTPQGAGLRDIRYSWFVNLELPWGKTRLADSSVITRYGFLVDPPTQANPDRLPVGFTKHYDAALNEELLDFTCAACHTGQIQVTDRRGTRALRIDGGQANHALTDAGMGQFTPTLIASMLATALNPFKFNRFAHRVLGAAYPRGIPHLHAELMSVIGTFTGIAITEKLKGLSPTEEGYGRTDALARIGNTVFAEHLSRDNYKVGNGPVNFPSLWNIWKFDWVQYNASVSQPMARNMGEAMGVGAKYDLLDAYGRPLPASERFRSTALIENLDSIEKVLRRLTPPVWDTTILGPIDWTKANAGKALFAQTCATCHGPFVATDAVKKRDAPGLAATEQEWLLATLCADDIGTDPNAANNFSAWRENITRTGLTAADLRAVAAPSTEQWVVRDSVFLAGEIARLRTFPDSAKRMDSLQYDLKNLRGWAAKELAAIDPSSLPMGNALSYLGTMVRAKAYADGHYTAEQQAVLDGFGSLDRPQVLNAYRPKPLGGMWATPPFLHNGSVPTIYDLLSDPAKRPKTFQVGSREYDTKLLGLKPVKGFWKYDTSKPGNHNTGHEFGPGYIAGSDRQPKAGLIGRTLTEDEKFQIIEYLKVRVDSESTRLNAADTTKAPPRFSQASHVCRGP